MDNSHKVGDYVVIKPTPPVVGKVIRVHENGHIVVKWPSGVESYGAEESYITVLSARTVAQILSKER